MVQKILIMNVGSNSIKFKIYAQNSKREIANGSCERIAIDGLFKIAYFKNDLQEKNSFLSYEMPENFPTYEIAIDYLMQKLIDLQILNSLEEIIAVGHRIVHGGIYFYEAVIIDEDVERKIAELSELAPLHNTYELMVYQKLKLALPNVKHVAVFDTAFHHTIPKINCLYAVPKLWKDDLHVRKYGAHGISYAYVLKQAKKLLKKDQVNLIACHLGSGASICAIKNSNSIDTSMGFTPMSGLIMGRRCGDLDPSIHEYIARKLNLSITEINKILNEEAGMKGMVGISDFLDLSKKIVKGNEFDFAVDLYAKRVSEYLVRYINELDNKVDAIIFTGGVAENTADIRNRIINNVKIMNVKLAKMANKKNKDQSKISKPLSKKVYLIKANEEKEILEQLLNLI
ncbi:MAG: acetate/propionate family kinase [Mycoplasmoidaceae bacterium]